MTPEERKKLTEIFMAQMSVPNPWPKEPSVDLGPEPITAYRLFLRRHTTAALSSLWRMQVRWQPGQIIKSHCLAQAGLTCKFCPHQLVGEQSKPHKYCNCGIWAVRTEHDLHTIKLPDSFVFAPNQVKPEIVQGQIQLWGQVVEHERGFRAEFGRIVPYSIEPYTRRTEGDYQREYYERMLQIQEERHKRVQELRVKRSQQYSLILDELLKSTRQKEGHGNGPST